MHVIIINKDQQKYVKKMKKRLCSEKYGIEPLFVFDRCKPVKNCNYIHNTTGEGFLAGQMRDLGAAEIDDDILFLDGDKIPNGDIIHDINSLKMKYDCICYGLKPKYETSDYRKFMHNKNTDDIVPFQKNKCHFSCGTYSCGIWLSKEAIRALRNVNNGRIFHPSFDGYWGDEDNFLADELYYLGFKIGYSTNIRLSGKFGKLTEEKLMSLRKNFMKRVDLRIKLFNAQA